MEDHSRRPVVLQPTGDAQAYSNAFDVALDGSAAKIRFREFFRNFRLGNVYIYRDALVRQWDRREYYLEVDIAHLNEYDEILFNNLQIFPGDFLPLFESGAKDALKMFLTIQGVNDINQANIPDFQIILKSAQLPQSLRNLTADHVNKLIKVPGIVIKCSDIRNKAIEVCFQCTNCFSYQRVPCVSAMASVTVPGRCNQGGAGGKECKPGSMVIVADACKYYDQQKLKLQESPEVVPTGEMPRNILLTIERYLVDRVSPGTRVSVMGIFSLFQSGASQKVQASSSVRTPYLRVVGIQVESEGGGRVSSHFTPQEEEIFQRMARDPDIYKKLANSIAPQISGDYTKDIKKALACLLMGGSRKVLPDGVRLRGDINVLLMGDPSTAKSQFLKFIERVAPIGVYTSGKGSSAAGLTAAVIKDAKGEFFLEGGAMVLADGGVICIDEFDKMRETDRVAIHEAMEQQTISIAKAGITTVLNSRSSVLAAANPIYGRYDDLKGVGENIDLMTTILSRFDCIFIVRDIRDQERDRGIARHVLGVHVNAALSDNSHQNQVDIDAQTLKKYVAYCRERCAPRLNDEAASILSGQFVTIRNRVRESLKAGESQVVPITVRQLEALVRLSESLAKMRLSAEATVSDVNEAIRLFRISTLAASEADPTLRSALGNSSEEVKRAEDFLRRRIAIRMTVNAKKVYEEALIQGYSDDSVHRAVAAMVLRHELQELNQRKLLRRIK